MAPFRNTVGRSLGDILVGGDWGTGLCPANPFRGYVVGDLRGGVLDVASGTVSSPIAIDGAAVTALRIFANAGSANQELLVPPHTQVHQAWAVGAMAPFRNSVGRTLEEIHFPAPTEN
jgi:hypothetical protein